LRFDCEANRKAQDANWDTPLPKKATDGHHAKAYNNPGWITKNNKQFAVGKKEANQGTREDWCIICPEIPNQKRRKDEAPNGERHP
jgi:hypothetical protein